MQVGTLDSQSKVFQKAMEVNHQIKAYRESEDPSDRELAEEWSGLVRDTLRLGKAMLTPMTAEERAEVLSRPLSTASDGSLTRSPPEDPAALKALENGTLGTNGTTQEPLRKGPGRPKGSKNKPKAV